MPWAIIQYTVVFNRGVKSDHPKNKMPITLYITLNVNIIAGVLTAVCHTITCTYMCKHDFFYVTFISCINYLSHIANYSEMYKCMSRLPSNVKNTIIFVEFVKLNIDYLNFNVEHQLNNVDLTCIKERLIYVNLKRQGFT